MEVVEWNKSWSPSLPCCPVNRQCLWKKTLIEKKKQKNSDLAGNLNNILGTNKESEDDDSDSGLKSLIQGLDKDEEIGENINKDLADIANKVW